MANKPSEPAAAETAEERTRRRAHTASIGLGTAIFGFIFGLLGLVLPGASIWSGLLLAAGGAAAGFAMLNTEGGRKFIDGITGTQASPAPAPSRPAPAGGQSPAANAPTPEPAPGAAGPGKDTNDGGITFADAAAAAARDGSETRGAGTGSGSSRDWSANMEAIKRRLEAAQQTLNQYPILKSAAGGVGFVLGAIATKPMLAGTKAVGKGLIATPVYGIRGLRAAGSGIWNAITFVAGASRDPLAGINNEAITDPIKEATASLKTERVRVSQKAIHAVGQEAAGKSPLLVDEYKIQLKVQHALEHAMPRGKAPPDVVVNLVRDHLRNQPELIDHFIKYPQDLTPVLEKVDLLAPQKVPEALKRAGNTPHRPKLGEHVRSAWDWVRRRGNPVRRILQPDGSRVSPGGTPAPPAPELAPGTEAAARQQTRELGHGDASGVGNDPGKTYRVTTDEVGSGGGPAAESGSAESRAHAAAAPETPPETPTPRKPRVAPKKKALSLTVKEVLDARANGRPGAAQEPTVQPGDVYEVVGGGPAEAQTPSVSQPGAFGVEPTAPVSSAPNIPPTAQEAFDASLRAFLENADADDPEVRAFKAALEEKFGKPKSGSPSYTPEQVLKVDINDYAGGDHPVRNLRRAADRAANAKPPVVPESAQSASTAVDTLQKPTSQQNGHVPKGKNSPTHRGGRNSAFDRVGKHHHTGAGTRGEIDFFTGDGYQPSPLQQEVAKQELGITPEAPRPAKSLVPKEIASPPTPKTEVPAGAGTSAAESAPGKTVPRRKGAVGRYGGWVLAGEFALIDVARGFETYYNAQETSPDPKMDGVITTATGMLRTVEGLTVGLPYLPADIVDLPYTFNLLKRPEVTCGDKYRKAVDPYVKPITDPIVKPLEHEFTTLKENATLKVRPNHIVRKNLATLAEQFGKEKGCVADPDTMSLTELSELGDYINQEIERQKAIRDAHSSWNPRKWGENTKKQNAAKGVLVLALAAQKELSALEDMRASEKAARGQQWLDNIIPPSMRGAVPDSPVPPKVR